MNEVNNRMKMLDTYIHLNQQIKDKLLVNMKPHPQYIKDLGYKRICEVGVRDGINFERLYKSDPDVLVGVDIWTEDGNIYHNDKGFTLTELDKQYNTIVNKYKDDKRVKVLRMYSTEAAKQFEDNYFDLVFIDADHSYEGVKADIEAYYPKVRQGGILCGHDYHNVDLTVKAHKLKFGAKRAVDEFVKKYNLQDRFKCTPKIPNNNRGGAIPCWFIFK